MKRFQRLLLILVAAVGQTWTVSSAARAGSANLDFTLDRPAVTSAGVYDAEGRLVRVLWTMAKTDTGNFTRTWDGKDDAGQAAPAGAYRFKIAVNRAAYVNVGAIGNSGEPTDAAGHTPTHMTAVAVDDEGSVYTTNGWDEAGADFKKWDKDGKSVYDAHYQIRNGKPNGAPYAIAVDDKYIYCSVGGWAQAPWNEAQQIQRFRRSDGKEEKFTRTGREDGHIQVYEWPSREMPEWANHELAEQMKLPLSSLAIRGDLIYCVDALGNQILKFDKSSGESKGHVDLKWAAGRPMRSLAFDGDGHLWARCTYHFAPVIEGDDDFYGLFDNSPEYVSLSAGSDRRMYCASAERGVVRIYDPPQKGKVPVHVASFGHKAQPGDRAADAFFELNGAAVDKNGNVFTIQDEPYGGARLAKWSPDGNSGFKLAWEHFGCEFVSLGNYAADDPDAFYSMTFHRYKLGDHQAGKWDYTGCVAPFETRRFYGDIHGVPRVLTINGRHFYFLPSGDGVQIYRVERNQLKLASLLGGRNPAPDGQRESKQLGQWSWHDTTGNGDPQPHEINWFKQPGQGHYACFGMDVDAAGNIVFADTSTRSIREIPIGRIDSRGNPTYDWKDAKETIAKDTSPLKFEPTIAQRAGDGSVYAFGWSARWPQPKDNPFWMGGTTLARFDRSGKLLWAVGLPKICVGLDVIPGGDGGCIAGVGNGARLLHYSADGLLLGSMEPGEAMHKQSGRLDNHASVSVNRDPRGHNLDVFAEDDYTLRIAWYRVDDHATRTLWGEVQLRQP